MSEEEKLPEKCCAKCGFLYAVCDGNVDAESAIFDPNFLRKSNYQITQDLTETSTVSRETRRKNSIVSRYKLQDVNFLGCMKTMVPDGFFDPGGNRGTNALKEAERMLGFLRNDRSQICKDTFFPYRPGFSAKEHAEIRLQEERDAQQQAFQERWNNILHNAEQYWQKKRMIIDGLMLL